MAGGEGGHAELEEEDEEEEPEAALAAAMEDPDLECSSYYELCGRVPAHHWAFEWVCPKPPQLSGCCLVPTIGGIGLIGARLAALGAEVVVSIGSGGCLVEWLLAARFGTVICVDVFYKPDESGQVSKWVVPQARRAVAAGWHKAGGEAQSEGGEGLLFLHPGEAARLGELLCGRRAALLLCWPQLQPRDIAAYAEVAGGVDRVLGVVVVAGENCSPRNPADAAAAAGCSRTAVVEGGEEVRCLSEPCWAWAFPPVAAASPHDCSEGPAAEG